MSVTSQIIDGRLASQIEERDDVAKVFAANADNTPENVDAQKVAPRGNSDYEFAQRAASGEMAAFEEIYQRHNRRVYSLCLRMTQNPPEAEDLTQEVFIQLFRKIGSFRGESAFTTWLHRMTVNQVLMHFRKRSVRDEKTTEEGETPEQVVLGTANPLTMPIVDRLALNRAISQLPNGYRTVFVLHDVEGYEHEEIARIMSLSVGTSKSQLHKARMKLRNLLRQQKEVS
ncbi:MAG: RNA polymerase sigma factor [Pyrinomonadaceae bacterium]|nr:RNA polymerase sigma factor [Pyrinomonadaceae bacterium]